MKLIFTILFLSLASISLYSQNIEDLSFGTDSTFEVMTWNIEWFPKNGQVTIDYVTEIIEALDIDLLAIQEVDNINAFEQMMDNLSSYDGYLESSWFAGLAYIYKPDVIEINDIYEIYTTYPYWSPFPRSPMVMDLNFMNERIIVINNHFKCCGDGVLDLSDPDDEETRRLYASNLLKEYIDTNFPNEKTIVLGDLNDDIADDPENNVFQQFLADDENYSFTDLEIALGNSTGWSYPTWPSHLDHILITNELFDDFENDSSVIEVIKIDNYIEGGWWQYEDNISDHRPVALKLNLNKSLSVEDNNKFKPVFFNFPNPFVFETNISIPDLNGLIEVKIFNGFGQLVYSRNIPKGITSMVWNAQDFPGGTYTARLILNKNTIAYTKLILIK